MKLENDIKLIRVKEILTNFDKIMNIENKKYIHRQFSDAELMQRAVDHIRDVVCIGDEPIMLANIELD